MRIVSGDKLTTHAALPPSDAEQRQPCGKIKNITSQVRYREMAGTLKLDTCGANEPKGTTLPPSPPLTNQQTGERYVLALLLLKQDASKARTKNLYSHNNPKAANSYYVDLLVIPER